MEFIISEAIKVHPMALAAPERVEAPKERRTIERLVAHHARPEDYFVERLSEGVGTIAAAFYPKPVVVRMSDFTALSSRTRVPSTSVEKIACSL